MGTLVAESGFQGLDAGLEERLEDRDVLLLQPVQAAVGLVEVGEDVPEARLHALLQGVEPALDSGKPVVTRDELLVDLLLPHPAIGFKRVDFETADRAQPGGTVAK
jgi:hypothetical protein